MVLNQVEQPGMHILRPPCKPSDLYQALLIRCMVMPCGKPNGFQYYEYLLAYVDDILVLSHNPVVVMKALADYYRLKDGYEKPKHYLGAEVIEWHFPEDATKV